MAAFVTGRCSALCRSRPSWCPSTNTGRFDRADVIRADPELGDGEDKK